MVILEYRFEHVNTLFRYTRGVAMMITGGGIICKELMCLVYICNVLLKGNNVVEYKLYCIVSFGH